MKTIIKKDLSNLESLIDATADITEAVFDFILQLESLAKDIPFIGTIVKALRFSSGLPQAFLLYKVEKFRKEIDNVSDDKKKTFADKMNSNPTFNKKVGITVLLMLEKLNDFDKTPLAGKVYCEFIKGNIDFPKVVRLTSIIESLTIYDLESLKLAYQGSIVDDITQQILSNAGVMTLSEIDAGKITVGGKLSAPPKFTINKLGELLVEICFPEAREIKETLSRI